MKPSHVRRLLPGAGPLLLYCAAIYTISAMPEPPGPDLGFEWGDKVLHAAAYFIMGGLAIRAVRTVAPLWGLGKIMIVALASCVLYGATDEFHQSFVPGRHADILDLAADAVGAAIGVGTLALIGNTRLGRMIIEFGVARDASER